MLDKKFFQVLGKKVLKMYKAHIFDRATDVRGNKFKGYSAKYGAKKRAGELTGQWAGSTGTTAPIVSGRFKNNLKYRGAKPDRFKIGWDSWGSIVNYLADRGRFVTTDKDPFPKDVIIEIDRQFKKKVEAHKLFKSRHIKIKLGERLRGLGK